MHNGIEKLLFILEKSGKNYDLLKIRQASRMAADLHEVQYRNAGEAYISHPIAVAEIVAGLELDTDSICAALLHDVAEDTHITLEQLAREFPEEVMAVLRLLTHEKGTDYFDYVRNIRQNPIAVKVKLADLAHNSDVTRLPPQLRNPEREERYRRAIAILTEE